MPITFELIFRTVFAFCGLTTAYVGVCNKNSAEIFKKIRVRNPLKLRQMLVCFGGL